MRLIKSLILVAVCLCSMNASAFCFVQAGERYHLDPMLLEAMVIQESGGHPKITNTNRNKAGKVLSTDYGLMGINSIHIPKLISMGVIRSKDDLLNNPCLNVQIGAWILAKHLQTCGVSWSCLGSYNAGFSDKNAGKREHYANLIYNLYVRVNRSQKITG